MAGLVAIGLFGVLQLALLFGDLSGGTLWNTDDALYGFVVRRMVEARSLEPSPWFDYDIAQAYPLGVRWMALVTMVAGTGPFGLRLSALIAGLVAAGALGSLGPRGDPRGLVAAGLWLVQPLAHLFSQRVMHDALLAALTAGAIALYHHANARPRRIFIAGLLCGAASLVKAWAGGIALAVIAIDLLMFRRAWLRRGIAWLGLLAALGLPIAWLAAAGQLRGLAQHMFVRLFVGLPGHGAAVAAATDSMAGHGAPETIAGQGVAGVVLCGLAAIGVIFAARRRDALDRLILVWCVVGIAIVLVTKTFLPQYALVAVLPMCAVAGTAVAALLARVERWSNLLLALPLLGLSVALVDVGNVARHADDRTAALATLQARAPAGALVCTIDTYHASPAFYAERPVVYLTEDAASLQILRRVFGEETVPTLRHGELVERLDAAPAVACILSGARARELVSQLRGRYETIAPGEEVIGADVVLLRR